MEGFARTFTSSLRPAENGAPPLPRRVLRYLVIRHRFGPGSRIIIGGDEADGLAAYFGRLGINAATADTTPLKAGRCDAAIWLELDAARAGDRSLPSPALHRTAALRATLRPGGRFLLVSRVGEPGGGHGPACLGRHPTSFGERIGLALFADRSLANWLGRRQQGYAVESRQVLDPAIDPTLWHHEAPTTPPEPCGAWADGNFRPRKVA